jgi:hypothetical protein
MFFVQTAACYGDIQLPSSVQKRVLHHIESVLFAMWYTEELMRRLGATDARTQEAIDAEEQEDDEAGGDEL